MKNLLQEEIERYRKLSNYNPKMTLSENEKELEEAGVGFSPATDAAAVEGALKSNLQALLRRLKITEMSVGEVTTLLEKDAAKFEKEFTKALEKDLKNGVRPGELGPLAKNLSKIDVLRRVSEESKNLGRPLEEAEFLKIIDDVAAANKTKAAKFGIGKPPVPKEPKIPENDKGKWEQERDPDKNKWTWKRLAKWGVGAGVGLASLYAIYKMTHGEEPPVVTGDIPPTPTPTPLPRPNYRDCTGIYSKGCKGEAVKKVQACIKSNPPLKVDGLYGRRTDAALKVLGYNSFRDEDVDKICNSTKEVNPWDYTPDTIDSAAPQQNTTTRVDNNQQQGTTRTVPPVDSSLQGAPSSDDLRNV